MNFTDLLKNKAVLYVVLFLAITSIVGYIYVEDFEAIIFFLAVGYLSTFFSKNMIINLAVPMLATNLLFSRRGVFEGMENNCEKCEECEKCVDGECQDENCEKCGCQEGMKVKKETKKEGMKKAKKEGKKEPMKKQKFSNRKLAPAAATEGEEDMVTGKHIDYSATLEQAYDNLQNILGDGGMESLTSETRDLIKQQKSLMKTMQSMAPILKNANSVLSNVDMSQMNNAMGSITSLLGNFGGNKGDN